MPFSRRFAFRSHEESRHGLLFGAAVVSRCCEAPANSTRHILLDTQCAEYSRFAPLVAVGVTG
jgi:hypothetical protein